MIDKRPLIIAFSAICILLAVEAIRSQIVPRYWLNLTGSEPRGIYKLVETSMPLTRGEVILMKCPPGYEKYLYGRKWLPKGWPLFKTVGALPGEYFCIGDAEFSVNGKIIGHAYPQDRSGLPMPAIRGCATVRGKHFLPIATGLKTSFDGRYFGDVPDTLIIGLAQPVITF
ncbi:MAG: S26 family signal peptidase [Desulfuromonadales bacterium]|nr:S26 family signal peptidase [Desulfuromonadales bacterium]